MEAQIRYRYADIGHWLARCDHSTGIIELNRTEFPKLSPLYKDYVWLHECVHLLYNVYDEAKCNEITDMLFLQRACSRSDYRARQRFIERSNAISIEKTSASERSYDGLLAALMLLAIIVIVTK